MESWIRNIFKELKVSSIEELDQLTKCLGPELKKYALSIRSANTLQPERGLILIWARLEDRYGKPEMVEAALIANSETFQGSRKQTQSDFMTC